MKESHSNEFYKKDFFIIEFKRPNKTKTFKLFDFLENYYELDRSEEYKMEEIINKLNVLKQTYLQKVKNKSYTKIQEYSRFVDKNIEKEVKL